MSKPPDVKPTSPQEQRKYRRFPLHYPVSVQFGHRKSRGELQAVSQNMSVRGLLVHSDSPIPTGSEVSFLITVREAYIPRPIRLAGGGTVVRVESVRSGAGFLIAVKCKRSISEAGSSAKTYFSKT